MDKVQLLHQATGRFRSLLESLATNDRDIAELLAALRPLFADIDAGRVVPPTTGRYGARIHSEDPKYGLGTAVFSAQADFWSALEDWPSRPGYPA
jgi:hypothetical protein